MLIFDDNNRALIVEDIYTPLPIDYFWVLDLNMLDFTLTPLLVLEETTCPSVKVRVNGSDFFLPATWHMLVFSEETLELDVVEIGDLAGREFTAFIYDNTNPQIVKYKPSVVQVIDYSPMHQNVAPAMNKHQMLCHPVGPAEWICISSSDCYNKFLKDMVIGDIIG